MDEQARNRLQKLMGAHNTKLEEVENNVAQAKQRNRDFQEAFIAHVNNVIIPGLKPLVDTLEENGHRVELADRGFDSHYGAALTINVSPKQPPRELHFYSTPALETKKEPIKIRFSACKDQEKVNIWMSPYSAGEYGGAPVADIELHDFTCERAIDEVVTVLERELPKSSQGG